MCVLLMRHPKSALALFSPVYDYSSLSHATSNRPICTSHHYRLLSGVCQRSVTHIIRTIHLGSRPAPFCSSAVLFKCFLFKTSLSIEGDESQMIYSFYGSVFIF